MFVGDGNDTAVTEPVRAAADVLRRRHAGAQLHVLQTSSGGAPPALHEYGGLLQAGGRAIDAAAPHVSRDALLLLLPPHAEFNQDFLNRVSAADHVRSCLIIQILIGRNDL